MCCLISSLEIRIISVVFLSREKILAWFKILYRDKLFLETKSKMNVIRVLFSEEFWRAVQTLACGISFKEQKMFLNSIFLDWTTLEATGLSSSIYSIRLVLQGPKPGSCLFYFPRSALRREPWTENERNASDRERVAVSPSEESWQSPAVPWDLCHEFSCLRTTWAILPFLGKLKNLTLSSPQERGTLFAHVAKNVEIDRVIFQKEKPEILLHSSPCRSYL